MSKQVKANYSMDLEVARAKIKQDPNLGASYHDARHRFLDLTAEYRCCVLIKRSFFDDKRAETNK